MNENKIIITGANGFIGSSLVKYFSEKGWQVIGLVHSPPAVNIKNVLYVKYELSQQPGDAYFSGADYLIHCAYAKNEYEKNIEGTRLLLAASRKFNLRKNIFISSFSASATADSIYGRQKFEAEKLFTTESDCIIRAGFVIGNGGLFHQIKNQICRSSIVPLIDGGKQQMQTVAINELVYSVDRILTGKFSGCFCIAESEPVNYKDFFRAVCEKLSKKPVFIPVPYQLLYTILSLAEFIRIPLPVSSESLRGLKSMQFIETSGDLKKLGINISNYKESLREIV